MLLQSLEIMSILDSICPDSTIGEAIGRFTFSIDTNYIGELINT